jgi:hypothetical protein
MSPYETLLEDDELLFEDDLEDYEDSAFIEDIDESFTESDDEFAERRGRRRSRKPRRVKTGPTGRGRGYVKPRPNSQYATQAQLQAGLARVGKDIRSNGEAIKRVVAQINKVTTDIASVNNRQDAELTAARKEIKKHNESAKNQSQLPILLTLLAKSPELEARPGADTVAAGAVINNVQIKKQDNTLPLMIMMMAGGMGGGSSDNSMTNMLPFILLMDK